MRHVQLAHTHGLRGEEEEFHSRSSGGAPATVSSTAVRFIVRLRLTSLSGFCLYSRVRVRVCVCICGIRQLYDDAVSHTVGEQQLSIFSEEH